MISRRAPWALRAIRALMAAVEWLLRLWVLRRRLPEVKEHFREVPYGEEKKHRLDIIVPHGQGPFPIMLYAHGGGWVTGDKSNFTWVARAFAQSGLVVFNVNYRPAPEAPFPEQVRDLSRALAWARRSAREQGGDPDRVFLAGDSTGAHLVCWLHVALHQPALLHSAGIQAPLPNGALRGALLFYGIYDLEAAWNLAR